MRSSLIKWFLVAKQSVGCCQPIGWLSPTGRLETKTAHLVNGLARFVIVKSGIITDKKPPKLSLGA